MAESNEHVYGNGSLNDGESVLLREDLSDEGAEGEQESLATKVLEGQLEQMANMKRQMDGQMELLHRDGMKLVEKQKALTSERKRLTEERERIAALYAEVEDGNKKLAAKGAEIARGMEELQQLGVDREKWERELAESRAGVAAAEERWEKLRMETAAAEERLAEVEKLVRRREEIELQIADADEKLAKLRGEMGDLERMRKDLEDRAAELVSQDQSLREREAAVANLAQRRAEIERMQGEMAREREGIDAKRHDMEEKAAAATKSIDAGLTRAKEQLAEAKAAMDGLSATKQDLEQREEVVAARTEALAESAKQQEQRAKNMEMREQELQASKREVNETRAQLLARQSELVAAARKMAEAEAASALEKEKQALVKQRDDLNKKLELMEGELAEQFESVAKQTRRLLERKAEIDARSMEFEKGSESRVAEATAELQAKLAKAQENSAIQALELEEKLRKAEDELQAVKSREAELEQSLQTAVAETAELQNQLTQTGDKLTAEDQDRTQQIELLAAQVMRLEKEAIEWQQKVDQAAAGGEASAGMDQLMQAASAARGESESLRAQVAELSVAKTDLAARLAAADGQTTILQKQAETLSQQLAAAEKDVAAWREKYEAAAKASDSGTVAAAATAAAGAASDDLQTMAKQLKMLEQQRDDLVGKLFVAQDAIKRQEEDAVLQRNAMEHEIRALTANYENLARAKSVNPDPDAAPNVVTIGTSAALPQMSARHRDRMIKHARTLRSLRKETFERKTLLEKSSEHLAKERQQIRTRKENLDRVKQLLEQQETVMARKLASHSAFKTVALVGMFIILALAGSVAGVYHFILPTYQSDVTVSLYPPINLEGLDVNAWLTRQADVEVKSPSVKTEAWNILRAEGYGVHDVREAWEDSLSNLTVKLTPATQTLLIHYKGNDAAGVAQVCNAIARAYATPQATGEFAVTVPGKIVASATTPKSPSEDFRLLLSAGVAGIVVFVGLLFAMVARRVARRSHQGISQMTDETAPTSGL